MRIIYDPGDRVFMPEADMATTVVSQKGDKVILSNGHYMNVHEILPLYPGHIHYRESDQIPMMAVLRDGGTVRIEIDIQDWVREATLGELINLLAQEDATGAASVRESIFLHYTKLNHSLNNKWKICKRKHGRTAMQSTSLHRDKMMSWLWEFRRQEFDELDALLRMKE